MTDKEKELYRALQQLTSECTVIDQSAIPKKYLDGFVEAMDKAADLVREGLKNGAFN